MDHLFVQEQWEISLSLVGSPFPFPQMSFGKLKAGPTLASNLLNRLSSYERHPILFLVPKNCRSSKN